MPRNDPTDNGGLFIGRRPGTAPMRYRQRPEVGSLARRRIDSVLAGAVLVLETLVLATLWGPQPAGWLWVGSHVDWLTGDVVLGVVTAFVGMIVTMLASISVAMRLDRLWKLVRRASGRTQREGVLERIFVLGMLVGSLGFLTWLHVTKVLLSPLSPGKSVSGFIGF